MTHHQRGAVSLACVGASVALVYLGLDTGSWLMATVAVVAGLGFGIAGRRSPLSWVGITVGVLIVLAFVGLLIALANGGCCE
jgi:hypothetical protein